MKSLTLEQAIELATRSQNSGQFAEAESIYRQILAQMGDLAEVHNNLGTLLVAQNRFAEAVQSFRTATLLRPELFQIHLNLGDALQRVGSFEESIGAYKQALQIKEDLAEAHTNLGGALVRLERYEQAIASLQMALKLQPDSFEANNNLVYALRKVGRLQEAVSACQRTLSINPMSADAHNNMGNVLQDLGRSRDAIAAYRQALQLNPLFAECDANLSIALNETGQINEAISVAAEAIRLQPGLAIAHNSMGQALKDCGRVPEAIESYKIAIDADPFSAMYHSNLIYAMHFHPQLDGRAIAAEAKRWDERFGHPQSTFNQPHQSDRDPNRPLRVGYVGADFRDHCQSFFTIPLFAHHDRSKVEAYCYSNVTRPDATTARIRSLVPHWREIFGHADQEVAQQIREDQIDILVDLTVHMSGNRLHVFAQRPAPIQMTWLGYPGTTGLKALDYRITDAYLDPDESGDPFYSEKPLRLPDSFWCYDPLTSGPDVSELPAVQNGYITFGCLNNFAKVNPITFELWMRVLSALPRSRLLFLCPNGPHREKLLEHAESSGVARNRLEMVERMSREQYLATYNRIDLVLDTFPYNGHTTTLDALWMGVPTISMAGDHAVSRGGLSILSQLSMQGYISRTETEFESIAIKSASDIAGLASQRRSLRERFQNSPLMNGQRFAQNIEKIFFESRASQ